MTRKLDLRTGRPVWYAYRAPAVPADTADARRQGGRADRRHGHQRRHDGRGADRATAMSVVAIDRRGPLLGLDRRDHRAGAVRDRPAADDPVEHDRQGRRPSGLAALAAGGRQSRGAHRRARHRLRHGRARSRSISPAMCLVPASCAEEAEARRAGRHPRDLSDAATTLQERFGIDRDGAILSHGNLALDPRKLTAGLLLQGGWSGRRALLRAGRGDRRSSDSKDEVDRSPPRTGPTITAGHVVLATGYELMDIVPADKPPDHLDLGDRHQAAAAKRSGRARPSSGRLPIPISTCAPPATAASSAAARTRISPTRNSATR